MSHTYEIEQRVSLVLMFLWVSFFSCRPIDSKVEYKNEVQSVRDKK